MADRFRYSGDGWQTIATLLSQLIPPTAAHRSYLENEANNFQWLYDRTDPGSGDVKAAKACWRDIAKHSEELRRALIRLGRLPTKPLRSLQFAMADHPVKSREDYRRWQKQTRALMRSAKVSARGWPKSRKGSNRARGDLLEQFLCTLLEFWSERGGYRGKSPGSPAVKFILATATPVAPDLKATTVSHFIRHEIDVVRPRRALQLAARK